MLKETVGHHQQVLEELGRRICGGEVPPGEVLRIDELCAELELSRPVVREAMRVLSAMGLVESRRRLGTVVQPVENWNLFDPAVIRWRLAGAQRPAQVRAIVELRTAVEPEAAALAAERADDEYRAELLQLADEMVRAAGIPAEAGDQQDEGGAGPVDIEAFVAADVLFHRVLLEACGNPMFTRLRSMVDELLRGRLTHQLMPGQLDPASVRLHHTLAVAVRDGEAAEARRLSRLILIRSTEEIDELSSRGVAI